MQLHEIQSDLDSFSPVTLEEMDRVMLMNRFDTKFVFSADRLSSFLNLLAGNYKILEISGNRVFPYNTIYLDNSDFMFYHQHVTGKLSRYKVRYRTYENTGDTYLEVKIRTNKERTIKWRIPKSFNSMVIDNEAYDFIRNYISAEKLDLTPVMGNRFMRITLVGKDANERITIDNNMNFSTMDGKSAILPFMTIVELKSERFQCRSPFGSAVARAGIHPVGFSKYCIGNALLLEVPKKNLLKQRLLLLKKIENEYSKHVVA